MTRRHAGGRDQLRLDHRPLERCPAADLLRRPPADDLRQELRRQAAGRPDRADVVGCEHVAFVHILDDEE